MRALMVYHLRSALGGRVVWVALFMVALSVWHLGFKCQLTFDSAGVAASAREYGAERPFQEVTDTLVFAGLIVLLLSVGMTAHLTPNLLRRGFLDALHARPVSRPAMLMTLFLVQWAVVALTVGMVYLGTALAWGVQQGTWTHWLPALAGSFAVESAGVAAVMLFSGVMTEKTSATAILTLVVGVIGPAVFDKLSRISAPDSAASAIASVALLVIPRTLLVSNNVCLGMNGHEVSYAGLGQILISSACWLLLTISLFARRDY